MRWNLRTLFLIITTLAVLLAWKYNHRNQLLYATKRVQNLGGKVSYRWQEPAIASVEEPFFGQFSPRPARYTVRLPDGTKETRFRHETSRYTIRRKRKIGVVKHGSTTKPTVESIAAIWRGNDDVIVEAVQVDAKDVDEKFIEALVDLEGLRIVQIRRSRTYYRVDVCGPIYHEVEPDDLEATLAKLNEPFVRAKSLIEAQLPNVNIIDGVASHK